MPAWFSRFADIVADWPGSVLGMAGVVIALVIAAWAVIAWLRYRKRVADDRQYRTELRKFVLVSIAEVHEALNKLQSDMTNRYSGKNKEALKDLCRRAFERAIRIPYGKLERLVKAEADLPVIEEELTRYLNYYRGAQHDILHNYMTLSGMKPDPVLRENWLDAHKRCFSSLQELKALPRGSGLANLSETMTATNNGSWE